ncbi:MAG: sigma-70 family RNA polymerase sigma factor [Hyphomonadaceae bacterium]
MVKSDERQSEQASETLGAAERAHLADLLERVASDKDREAFAELFGFFAPRLKSYLMRLGSDAAQAEEIAQDVMVTVWRKADLYDRKQSSPSTWIFRVARNRRIDLFRRSKTVELDPEEPMVLPSAPPPPEAGVEAMEIEAQVRAAMAVLPPEQLELVRLAFYEGLSQSQIAEALGIPLGTVKSRTRLAFARMKEKLRDD